MTDTMTVKELAEVAGVNDRTIRRAIKDVLKIETRQGVEIRLDAAQCLQIVGSMRIKGEKQLRQNAGAPRQIAEAGQSVQPEIVKAFTEALQVMNKMADACLAMAAKVQSTQALPAPSEPEYVTIAGFCNLRRLSLSPEAIARAGRVASAIAQDRGVPVGKAPHERWGYVNTYPVSICAEAVAA
jgi:hypothetical protein